MRHESRRSPLNFDFTKLEEKRRQQYEDDLVSGKDFSHYPGDDPYEYYRYANGNFRSLSNGQRADRDPLEDENLNPNATLWMIRESDRKVFFDDPIEAEEYFRDNDINEDAIYEVGWHKELGGRHDVFSVRPQTAKQPDYWSQVTAGADGNFGSKYNHFRSFYQGQPVFEGCEGLSLEDYYNAFRELGNVKFHKDVFAIKEERQRRLNKAASALGAGSCGDLIED